MPARKKVAKKPPTTWQWFVSQSKAMQMLVFLIVFTAVGGGIAVYKSFALTRELTYQEHATNPEIVNHYGLNFADQGRTVWLTNSSAPGQWVWYGPYRGFDNRAGNWYFMEASFVIRDFNQAKGGPPSKVLIQIVHNQNDGKGIQVIKNASAQLSLNSAARSQYVSAWTLATQLDHIYYKNVEMRLKLISGWVGIDRVDFTYGDGRDTPPFP